MADLRGTIAYFESESEVYPFLKWLEENTSHVWQTGEKPCSAWWNRLLDEREAIRFNPFDGRMLHDTLESYQRLLKAGKCHGHVMQSVSTIMQAETEDIEFDAEEMM